MNKFKVGDTVKQTKNCSGTIVGKFYIVKLNIRLNDSFPSNGRILTIGWDPETQDGCQHQSYWKPATKEEYQIFKLAE